MTKEKYQTQERLVSYGTVFKNMTKAKTIKDLITLYEFCKRIISELYIEDRIAHEIYVNQRNRIDKAMEKRYNELKEVTKNGKI